MSLISTRWHGIIFVVMQEIIVWLRTWILQSLIFSRLLIGSLAKSLISERAVLVQLTILRWKRLNPCKLSLQSDRQLAAATDICWTLASNPSSSFRASPEWCLCSLAAFSADTLSKTLSPSFCMRCWIGAPFCLQRIFYSTWVYTLTRHI